jgi:hypothetical protein
MCSNIQLFKKGNSHDKCKEIAAKFVKEGKLSGSIYSAMSSRGKLVDEDKEDSGRMVTFSPHEVIMALSRTAIGINKFMVKY